jgi:hypothetical protein
MLPGIMTIGFLIAMPLGKLVYADNNQWLAEMLGGYMAGGLYQVYYGQFSKTTLGSLG